MGTPEKMLSPPRSPFRLPVSPPLSASVLKLQKLGLELGASASQSSLHVPSYTTSPCTTPSDLDKPLPLEPLELRRRTSSIYSNETTISNIIDMYGGLQDDGEWAPQFHDVSAYRDTIAPLHARWLSLSHSTWIPPIVPHKLRASVSSPIMRGATHFPMLSSADGKNAPSFVEFSRSLRERKNDIVSPFYPDTFDHHRQEALEKLAPPSPQDSSEALSVAYEQPQSFLPGPMSGTITDVVASDMVPAPLDLHRTSQVMRSPQEAARRAQTEQMAQIQPHYQQPNTTQSWSRIMEKLNNRKSQERREQQRVLDYASEKYPGMRSSQLRKDTERSSGSSITQRASNILQNLSRTAGKADRTPGSGGIGSMPRRQKQQAVKTTPYQEFGPDIWLPPEKQEKKRRREEKKLEKEARQQEKKGHRRNQSSGATMSSKGSDLSNAYHSGQNQIVGVIQGAKQRLSRSNSERRREKLRKNIVLVGPTQLTKEKNSFEGVG